jgi:putative Holliday junction resolvase
MIIDTLQEFCTFFKAQQPLISVDYGQKKIGLAISTPDHQMPLPFELITGDSEKKKLSHIVEVTRSKNICAIVVGLPINMDGTKSDQTIIVEKFVEKLKTRTYLPIFFQDERLTSRAADNLLKSFGIKRKNRNEYDDLAAASMILETTLNARNLLLNLA